MNIASDKRHYERLLQAATWALEQSVQGSGVWSFAVGMVRDLAPYMHSGRRISGDVFSVSKDERGRAVVTFGDRHGARDFRLSALTVWR